MKRLHLQYRPALLALAAGFFTADIAVAKPAGDVTAKVTAAVKDESLSISANYEMFGDTARGFQRS